MPEKVLLATDGSKDAALAARAAVDVCEGTGAELHVVHVWYSVPTARLRPFMRAELKKLGNELLEEGVKRVEDSGGHVSNTYLLEGRAADEILDLAGRIGADLVVMGSRGLGPVGRIALGSVSEAVIHHSHWPVLMLRGEDAWPPERVILGDNDSEAARAAGDLGASLCGRHGARALLLHAYPRLPEVVAEGRRSNPRIGDDELRKAEKALLERSQELESRLGSRPETRLVVGDAAACLLEAAEEDAPERTLLAVGSRGLGVIGRMRLGSVSTKVVRAGLGAVLVYPPVGEGR
jgi:nucleotide-binding universal stress UspA family protein